MNPRSIYFHLILWYSGLVIAVSLAFGAYTYHGVEGRLYHEMEQTFTRRALHIADNILSHTQNQQEIASQISAVYSPEANSRLIRILTKDGAVLYVSAPPKDGSFRADQVTLSKYTGRRIEHLSSGLELLVVSTAVKAAGEDYLVEMGMLTHELDTALHGLIATLLLGLPMVVLIVSAGGYVLVRRALKPVEDIRATAEQITLGNLSKRLPVLASGDELEHLSVTLNQMLVRLEDSYQQASRFSADASHELRTPLTIMRGELESMLAQKDGLTAEMRERIASVLEETERLSHIAESLFAMSRLDAGEGNTMHTLFNLAELVESITEQMTLLADEKAITLRVCVPQMVRVKGDTGRIKQVIVNLLDNAIKYTPHGGKINVTVALAGTKAVLTVADTGIGIAPEALPHVFERFYRADRVRAYEHGGAGLGLSIVRSICQAHGGTVEVESIEGKGTTCRVELPAANGKEVGI